MTTPFRGFDGAGPNRAAGTPDAPGAGRAGTDGFASGPGPSATRNQAGSGTGPGLPRISLPAGGGAIRGIDEKLTIGQATGAASLAVAVPTSPARQGFSPQLQLSYDSAGAGAPSASGGASRLQPPSRAGPRDKGLPGISPPTPRSLPRRARPLRVRQVLVPALLPLAVAGFCARRVRPTAATTCAATGRGWKPASPASNGGRTRRPGRCTGGRSPRTT